MHRESDGTRKPIHARQPRTKRQLNKHRPRGDGGRWNKEQEPDQRKSWAGETTVDLMDGLITQGTHSGRWKMGSRKASKGIRKRLRFEVKNTMEKKKKNTMEG